MNISFWSGEGQINPELFSIVAEKCAETICNDGLKGKKLEKNKISQLRKFYDEALRFKDLIKSGESIDDLLPYLKMLNAKAAYAEGRGLITRNFTTMLKKCLEQVDSRNPQSLEVFISFFEAFMGYYKYYESQINKDR
ncbi:MAG: type III-A CRISPR-associated protein Csm2 [Nitrospirae bacterium]|nr:type III-A CRISPR-associated protein Csm2 [Nitrospirota bacterium]